MRVEQEKENSCYRKKVEEVIAIQEQLSKIQVESCRKQEELDKREEKLKKQKREIEQDKRRIELKEQEIRRSVGADFGGFHASEKERSKAESLVSEEEINEFDDKMEREAATIRHRMRELVYFQEKIGKLQIDMYIRQDMLKKQEDEAKQKAENLAQAERNLEIREEELRKSLGADFSGFRCFGTPQTIVDPLLTLFKTPAITNQILQTSTETRELNLLKRALVVQQTPQSTAPRKQFVSIKLRKITEIVPSFDGNSTLVSKFVKTCSRALESLSLDYTEETETSLTRLLISKLNGHAYVVIENFRINKVEQLIERLKDAFLPAHSSNYYRGQLANKYKKPGKHVLDYFGRVRDLTQSIIDEESKARRKLERRMERVIEEESLDAFIRGLPSEYRTAMRYKKYKDFNSALLCILRVNKQIHNDAITSNSSNLKKNVSNIRQSKEVVNCTFCNKVGSSKRKCQQKLEYYRNEQAGRISPVLRDSNPLNFRNKQAGRRSQTFRNLNSPNFRNEQAERRPPIFGNSKPLNFTSRNQQCNYCEKMGHWKAE
ncbi:hypothetical protein M0802_015191 [Mischocyttarus mexicanus]|nr:hypothetical protein M0802_015191 [Mischocyttarus mexicanus]